MSHAVDFHGQVFVGNGEVFLFSNGFQNQSLTYLFSSCLFIVLAELFHGLADTLQVFIKSGVSGFHVHFDFVHDFIDMLFHHFLGNVYLGIGYSLFYESFVVSFFCLLESLQLHLLFHSSLQFIHGFKLADGFCEFIVQFRKLFAFYVTDMNLKFCFLAFQSIYEVVFRENDLNRYIVAGLMSFQLFFKAGDKALGTDFQRIGLAFAAFKGFSVNGAFEIDNSKVAFLQFCAFFCLFQSSVLFSSAFELCHHLVIGDFGRCFFSFQAFVFAQFYFRTFYESSSESGTFCFGEFVFFYIRGGDGNQFFLTECCVYCFVDDNVLGFCFNGFFAEMHFQDFAVCLAFTESRDSYLVGNAGYRFFESFLYNFSRQFDAYGNLVLIQCLYFYVHKKYSSLSRLTDK